jgi:hypothetical protein
MRNALRKKRIQQSPQAGSAAFPPAFPTAKIVCPFEKKYAEWTHRD